MKHFAIPSILFAILFLFSDAGAQPKRTRDSGQPKASKTVESRNAKLLIRRLRTGVLAAGGIVLVVRLDEASLNYPPELKDKLELESSAGLEVERDYVILVKSPGGDYYQDRVEKWAYEPAKFNFVLIWHSAYKEQLDSEPYDLKIQVNETFEIYKASARSQKQKWSISYELARDIRASSAEEKARDVQSLNENVIAPARSPILKEIRAFIEKQKTSTRRRHGVALRLRAE